MSDATCCKAGRVTAQHALEPPSDRADTIDEYLVARWKGTDAHERTGLRRLAEWLNKRILRAVYYRHGRTVYDVKIDAEYEVLADPDAGHAERAELLVDLETDGIDGDAVVDDFVSKSTLARHLKRCVGAEKTRTPPDPGSEWELDRIRISRDQLEKNVSKPLRSLETKGRLPGADDAELAASIVLSCPHCPTRARFREAIDQGYICEEHLGRRSPEHDSRR